MNRDSKKQDTATDANNVLAYSGGLQLFLDEQKHAQEQADNNERLLDELAEEWKKYPDGKPIVQFVGYGSHFH